MKNKNSKGTITFLLMLLSVSVFAQGPPGGGRGQGQGKQSGEKPDAAAIFSMLDVNNDDKIDKDEASNDKRGKIAEVFDDIDTNGDTFIDIEELKVSLDDATLKIISAEKIIKEVDDNGDGTLNELELAAKAKNTLIKNFKIIDTNQDNELNLEELKAFYLTREPKNKSSKKRK